ncbi:olfactory receptor 24-like [Salarias fasciatus]|uniref:olfactory receptor 24-like n=1 Tax=Salarias fasciatus TaxID=181472 RepID=UPI0011766C82|nr:olfactory receptor 24-like [Salarias fasciatus]
MRNSSSSLDFYYIELTEFEDYGPLRYVFFTLCLLLFMIIISANVVVILTVSLKKSLHQPMYIFICCLCVNSLLGSSGFFPRFLMDLLSDTHFISLPFCFIQMYVVVSCASHELPLLCIMAFDRLIAICHPLHYNSKMTLKTVVCVIIFVELYPALLVGIFVLTLVGLPLCRNKLHNLYCAKLSVLTCVDTTTNRRAVQVVSVTTVFLPLVLILYTYLRILTVCRRSSAKVKGKAFQTCLPHILIFLNFSFSVLCDLVMSSLRQSKSVHPAVIAVLTLERLAVHPLSNPLVYGFNLPQIRGVIFRRLKINMKCFFLLHDTKSNM